MAFFDRLRSAGAALFAATPPQVPGLTPIINSAQSRGNPAVAKILNSRDALFGKTSFSAGPSPSRYSQNPADGISPEIILACQRTADSGYPRLQAELYEQIAERDAHLAGVAKARIYEVSGKPWRLKPANETPVASAVAKFTRAALDEIDGLDSSLEDLLSANANGYACGEKIYAFQSIRFATEGKSSRTVTACTPTQIAWVHNKHFEFDLLTDEPYIVLSGTRQQLPPLKFVFHAASGTGFVERRGFMRPCAPLHAMKSWSIRDWALEEALFAIPQLTGHYPTGTEEYEANRDTFREILRNWGKGVPAWIPNDVEFTLSTTSRSNASGIQGAIIGFVNTEISKLVQGETLTTEIGNVGARAATETHADVRDAFIRADARRLATTLRNQLIRPMLALNTEVLASAIGCTPEEVMRAVPFIYWRIERETTPTERALLMLNFAERGQLDIDEEQVRDEFALDAPREGGKALRSSKAALDEATATSKEAAAVKDEADAKADEAPDEKKALSVMVAEFSALVHRFKSTDFKESEHPRDHGQFAPTGGGSSSDSDDEAPAEKHKANYTPAKTTPTAKKTITGEDGAEKRVAGASPGSQLPPATLERLKKLGITKLPAAHIHDVHVSDDLHGADDIVHGHALVKWKDDAGHPQSSYTPEFDKRNAAEKWKRVTENRPALEAAIKGLGEKAITSPPHAAALLIAQTGLRPGSSAGLKSTGHYGATTMEARHVTFSDGAAHVEYVGKEGVTNRATVTDPVLVAALKKNVEGKKPTDRVFPGVDSDKVSATLPDGVKTKDMRTTIATAQAERQLNAIDPGLTGDKKEDLKKVLGALKDVSTNVSKTLNNTPAMARKSYIAPQIIQSWGAKHGVPKEWLE